MRTLWLPTVLRAAGLTVHEVSGWKTRGADSFGPVRGVTCHHTAGSRTSSDAGEIGVLVNGRPGLSGPIAQLYLSRSGDWHVVASGHCNHNLPGWAGPNEGYGNDSLLGIEAQHSGDGEPWTARQYDSYVRGVAALVRHQASGWDVTVGRVAGHKEHQPGAKTDPSFNMDNFRAKVLAEITTWEDGVSSKDVIEALQSADGKAAIVAALKGWTEENPDSTATPKEQFRIGGLLRMSEQRARNRHAALLAAITGVDVDEQAVAAAVLAGLPVAAIAAAIPAELAGQVVTAVLAGLPRATVDELLARLAS